MPLKARLLLLSLPPHRSEPFFIGVAGEGSGPQLKACSSAAAHLLASATACHSPCPSGGTASGKTTVCDLISQRLQEQSVVMLSQDSFYRNLSQEELDNIKSGWHVCSTAQLQTVAVC